MPSKIKFRLLIVSLILLSSCSIHHIKTEKIPICQQDLEYWSEIHLSCTPCTKCAPQFTISPCAIHKDAICGPLSALELDLPFLNNKRNIKFTSDEIKHQDNNKNKLWKFSQLKITPEPLKTINNKNFHKNIDDENIELFNSHEFKISTDNFNDYNQMNYINNNYSNNKLSWDWQTSLFILAICACIIFFLVAGCSAIIYVRQWRRMKKNFEPVGLEEISTRLNLMVKAELAELSFDAMMNSDDPESRCQYLEKFLDRRRGTPMIMADNEWPEISGNFYIEEGTKTTRCKRAQIAQIHRNIETIVNHKQMININE